MGERRRDKEDKTLPLSRQPKASAGSFRIERVLGRGGMGVVYSGFDERLGRPVALKALPGELAADPDSLRRFEQEAKALARVSHPNVAVIHGVEEDDEGGLFLVMELVDGPALDERLEAGALPIGEAIDIAAQVADGLAAVHAAGLVHRDVKPSNVKLDGRGQAKLLDFGLAKAAREADADSRRLTGKGIVVGTPGYMSPEQLRGETVDAASDLWAWGCLVFECLSGSPAFEGGTTAERVAATLEREPCWERLPDSVPPALLQLLRDCLSKHAERRPSCIEDLLRRLRDPGQLAAVSRSLPREARTGNLPRRRTSFVGRAAELESLASLLTHHSLLTLTGVGGCGKTRFALELAESLTERFDGATWIVELAGLSEPAQVLPHLARTLGLQESSPDGLEEAVVAALGGRDALVILDNCEHLLDESARVADLLLERCVSLRIVATSREALGVEGERIEQLKSLSLPAPGSSLADTLKSESARLFADRAAGLGFQETDASAEELIEICWRLDGIPLALELAAARTQAMSLKEIADRLDDSFRLLVGGRRTALERHRTLRATLDWSHQLLDSGERLLYRRLAVFVGGWTLEQAERVCADEALPPRSVLGSLTQLVAQSLVVVERHGERTRYRYLEPVRQHALDHLSRSGETESVALRHLDAFADLAARSRAHLQGQGAAGWLDRLELEQPNLLAACENGLATNGRAAQSAQLILDSDRFWSVRGHLSDARRVIAEVLSREGEVDDALRARSSKLASTMAYFQADYSAAVDLLSRAAEIHESLGDRSELAGCLANLGVVARALGDRDRAVAHYETALSLYDELGDEAGRTICLNNLGLAAVERGEPKRAVELLSRALAGFESQHDEHGQADCLTNLGLAARDAEDWDAFRHHTERALALVQRLGSKHGTVTATANLGTYFRHRGENETARRHFEEARRLAEELGDDSTAAAVCVYQSLVELQDGKPDAARELCERSLETFRSREDAAQEAWASSHLGLIEAEAGAAEEAIARLDHALRLSDCLGMTADAALCLQALSFVATRSGSWNEAARVAGLAARLWELNGGVLREPERWSQLQARLTEALGDQALTEALREGSRLSPSAALALTREAHREESG